LEPKAQPPSRNDIATTPYFRRCPAPGPETAGETTTIYLCIVLISTAERCTSASNVTARTVASTVLAGNSSIQHFKDVR
jgi:hypothetical protein